MTNLIIFTFAAALVNASPAIAKDATAAPTAQVSGKADAAISPKTRYCVVSEITGSRIPTRVCQTRDRWLRDGFDPLAK